jgi:probable rRNA maturation factor
MPAFSIAVVSRQRAMRVDRRRLIRLAQSVLRQEQVASAEISVAILDDREIHAVNRQFLNHDYPTDVISFVLDCRVDKVASGKSPKNDRRGTAKVIDGEIVISAQTAVRNSASYGSDPQNELALYLVHGLLHICGYDDQTSIEKRLMRRREAEALLAFDILVPSRAAKRGRSPQ